MRILSSAQWSATTCAPRKRNGAEWLPRIFRKKEPVLPGIVFGRARRSITRDASSIESLPKETSLATKEVAEEAVDTALHNVLDMLEGFWELKAGPNHAVELVLQVRVQDSEGNEIESHDISPCKLGLPIGYWKWAKGREFK